MNVVSESVHEFVFPVFDITLTMALFIAPNSLYRVVSCEISLVCPREYDREIRQLTVCANRSGDTTRVFVSENNGWGHLR